MFGFCLTACKSETDNHNSQAEKNTANSKEVYRAAETGDVSRLDNFISADFVNYSGGAGDKEIKGRDSLKAAGFVTIPQVSLTKKYINITLTC